MVENREASQEFYRQEIVGKFGPIAQELAQWDKRIVEIAVMKEPDRNGQEKLDLICTFDPEPTSDATGFFWIVNLLTRMEFEALNEKLGIDEPFDLAFTMGQEVFLPNGKILTNTGDHIVLWQSHAK